MVLLTVSGCILAYAAIGCLSAKLTYWLGKECRWDDPGFLAGMSWVFWPIVGVAFAIGGYFQRQERKNRWTPWTWVKETPYDKKLRLAERADVLQRQLKEKEQKAASKREISQAKKKLQSIRTELRKND